MGSERTCVTQTMAINCVQFQAGPSMSAFCNTTPGNLKTAIAGTCHAFAISQYAHRCLAEFAYRFNRRFDLAGLTERLIVATATIQPRPEHRLRSAENAC